jgi:hypothetical protein
MAVSDLDGKLPAGPEGLEADLEDILRPILRDIQEGRLVVRWGRDLRDRLVAYEAEVPTAGGWVISNGEPREVSADEYKRLLALSP